MIALTQADWFTDNVIRIWPDMNYRQINNYVLNLPEDQYMKLKKLYFEGFASGGGKQENPVAQNALKMLLEGVVHVN